MLSKVATTVHMSIPCLFEILVRNEEKHFTLVFIISIRIKMSCLWLLPNLIPESTN